MQSSIFNAVCTYGDASESLSKAESVNQQRAKLDGVRQKECDQWDMKISLASAKYVVTRAMASNTRCNANIASLFVTNCPIHCTVEFVVMH